MVKKLPGKAQYELKGAALRQRNRDYDKAGQLCSKILVGVVIVVLVVMLWIYNMTHASK